MKPNFYNQFIETPLSLALNHPDWERSVIGKLTAKTNQSVYIKELTDTQQRAVYVWRVVDARFSDEDSTMTYFRAYGLDGKLLPEAVFGVTWASVPHRITGGFKYPPREDNKYYTPIDNKFMTPNTGGYSVEVLDTVHPSEALAFGLYKQGKHHRGLVVSFRLFSLGVGYPNDMNLRIR